MHNVSLEYRIRKYRNGEKHVLNCLAKIELKELKKPSFRVKTSSRTYRKCSCHQLKYSRGQFDLLISRFFLHLFRFKDVLMQTLYQNEAQLIALEKTKSF